MCDVISVQVLCNSSFLTEEKLLEKRDSKETLFGDCCFPEHPQKYCHDNIGCITQTVNKTLEYVSTRLGFSPLTEAESMW